MTNLFVSFFILLFCLLWTSSNGEILCDDGSNSTCTDSLGPNSLCNKEIKQQCGVKICTCLPKFVEAEVEPSKIECHPVAYINETCEFNEQCRASEAGEFSRCGPGGKCECNPSYFPGADTRGACVSGKKLGEVCRYNSECGSAVKNSTCTKHPDVDVHHGICECSINFDNVPGDIDNCYPQTRFVGDPCEKHHDAPCRMLKGAFCNKTTGNCECNPETQIPEKAYPGPTKCLPKRFNLNETCQDSDQCMVEGAVCTNGICRCPSDTHVPSSYWTKCLPLRNSTGESCEEDSQCEAESGLKYGACRENKCACQHAHIEQDRKCYLPIPLGVICGNRKMCVDSSLSSENTTCISYFCECNYKHVRVDHACVPVMEVGSRCDSSEECRASIEGGVVCVKASGKCECDAGYKEDETKKKCLEYAIPVGGNCETNWQCASNKCNDRCYK